MSAPIDTFDPPHVVAMEAGGEVQAPPKYDGGAPPCKFRGGRRGSCHRRRKLSFFRRFLLRTMAFFLFSILYTNRSAIFSRMQCVTHHLAKYTPDWMATAGDMVRTVAAAPFTISAYFGLLFYSAFFSLLVTGLHMRIMQKKKVRWQKWIQDNSNSNHGHGHGHGHAHHHGRFSWHRHHHPRLDHQQEHHQGEVSDNEKAPLLASQEA